MKENFISNKKIIIKINTLKRLNIKNIKIINYIKFYKYQ
jgi:hypothetical protein